MGWTTLRLAAISRHGSIVRLLLKKRAVINAKNNQGETALYMAAWVGIEPIVRLPPEKGANIDNEE